MDIQGPNAAVVLDSQCTVQGSLGESKKPSSPVFKDTLGVRLPEINVETTGGATVRWWGSINNVAAADDLWSNIRWRLLGTQEITDPGNHSVSKKLLDRLGDHRHIRAEPMFGAEDFITEIHF